MAHLKKMEMNPTTLASSSDTRQLLGRKRPRSPSVSVATGSAKRKSTIRVYEGSNGEEVWELSSEACSINGEVE